MKPIIPVNIIDEMSPKAQDKLYRFLAEKRRKYAVQILTNQQTKSKVAN